MSWKDCDPVWFSELGVCAKQNYGSIAKWELVSTTKGVTYVKIFCTCLTLNRFIAVILFPWLVVFVILVEGFYSWGPVRACPSLLTALHSSRKYTTWFFSSSIHQEVNNWRRVPDFGGQEKGIPHFGCIHKSIPFVVAYGVYPFWAAAWTPLSRCLFPHPPSDRKMKKVLV